MNWAWVSWGFLYFSGVEFHSVARSHSCTPHAHPPHPTGIKPEMPTEANVTRFMEIRSKVIGVLEMRRGIEKVEGDLRVALSRKQMLKGNAAVTSSLSS